MIVPVFPDAHPTDPDPFGMCFVCQLEAVFLIAVSAPIRDQDDVVDIPRVPMPLNLREALFQTLQDRGGSIRSHRTDHRFDHACISGMLCRNQHLGFIAKPYYREHIMAATFINYPVYRRLE